MDKTIIKRILILVVITIIANIIVISQFGLTAINKSNELFYDMGSTSVTAISNITEFTKNQSELIKENLIISGDNEALQMQNRALTSENETLTTKLEELESENEDLSSINKKTKKYDTIAGNIIRRSTNDWFDQVTINLGTDDGVTIGNAVMYQSTLLGYVDETMKDYSTVRLITNENIAITIPALAINSKKEYNGKLNNFDKDTNTFEFTSFTPDKELKLYDKIYTNGYTKGMPEGIQIGTIVDIDNENSTKQTIYKVQPSEDLYNARSINVLVSKDEE